HERRVFRLAANRAGHSLAATARRGGRVASRGARFQRARCFDPGPTRQPAELDVNDASPSVDGLTIGQVLARTAAAHGSRDALVFPAAGVRSTYAQFHRATYEAAKGLLALGVGKGEHVALWATNVPEWVILQFATARIGAVL